MCHTALCLSAAAHAASAHHVGSQLIQGTDEDAAANERLAADGEELAAQARSRQRLGSPAAASNQGHSLASGGEPRALGGIPNQFWKRLPNMLGAWYGKPPVDAHALAVRIVDSCFISLVVSTGLPGMMVSRCCSLPKVKPSPIDGELDAKGSADDEASLAPSRASSDNETAGCRSTATDVTTASQLIHCDELLKAAAEETRPVGTVFQQLQTGFVGSVLKNNIE